MFKNLGKKMQNVVVFTLCLGLIFLMVVGIALSVGLATPKNTTVGREILAYVLPAPTPAFVSVEELCPDKGQPSFIEDYGKFREAGGDPNEYPPVKDNIERVYARFGDYADLKGASQYYSCEFFRVYGMNPDGSAAYVTYRYQWENGQWVYKDEYCEYGCGPKEATPTPPVTSTKDANG